MFLVARRKCAESEADRYLLLTFENPPNNVKIGWKESLETFRKELKNLQFGTSHLETPGDAIRNTFDFLNRNRLRSGIDTFGHGRFPFNLEPAAIVILSDGIWPHGTDPLDIIQTSTDDFVKERYRWDQRELTSRQQVTCAIFLTVI
uniref:VWFA domain-containing protein n=1 Tax=Anopheles atroparvus TaxID=41427 RepID=A0A182IUS9_ANOAO